ncbi:hypothetical protein ANN_25054 [Periplaneta americana]|uniref:Uncharacterized protein n=1 Tax=Periplaneta americana TaxID=6978 RepID=A0ABQ8S0G6_PERAM|nr:hypothetical protein ANN_25054 [Periplaneta americana]
MYVLWMQMVSNVRQTVPCLSDLDDTPELEGSAVLFLFELLLPAAVLEENIDDVIKVDLRGTSDSMQRNAVYSLLKQNLFVKGLFHNVFRPLQCRHHVGEIELSAALCYELQASGKSCPQRTPTSFDVPTSDGSLPKANQTIGLPLLRRTHVPFSISECVRLSFVRCSFANSEIETLPHVLGSCPHGEALRNTRHHKVRSAIAQALRNTGFTVFEEFHGLSTIGNTRRIDMIAFQDHRRGFIIDPTVRFETCKSQPQDAHQEKQFSYEPTIPYYQEKYQLQQGYCEDHSPPREKKKMEDLDRRISRIAERYPDHKEDSDVLTYPRAIGDSLGGNF